MIIAWFHYLGSSMLVMLIAYVAVDIFRNNKMTFSGLAGRVLLLVILFLALVRTH